LFGLDSDENFGRNIGRTLYLKVDMGENIMSTMIKMVVKLVGIAAQHCFFYDP